MKNTGAPEFSSKIFPKSDNFEFRVFFNMFKKSKCSYHVGTCWLNLWGTSSPISLRVCAAYLEAIPLGLEATFFRDSMAPISWKRSVLPCCFLISASMQKWNAARFLASSRWDRRTGMRRFSQLMLWPWLCVADVRANSAGVCDWMKGSISSKIKTNHFLSNHCQLGISITYISEQHIFGIKKCTIQVFTYSTLSFTQHKIDHDYLHAKFFCGLC